MVNLAKPDSLYNNGMKILCFSQNAKQNENVGWHRVGESISYYENTFKREMIGVNGIQRYSRNFYTFTF
jgi:hypothetical protein